MRSTPGGFDACNSPAESKQAFILLAASEQAKSKRAITLLPIGQPARILQIRHPEYAGKLLAMGILPGQTIRLIRKAPFGGGWYAQVGAYSFALRAPEAEAIIVEA
jgi:ferrous iron transport protein A